MKTLKLKGLIKPFKLIKETKCVRFVFETNEVPPETVAALFDLQDSFGEVVFTEEATPEMKNEF